MSFSMVLKTGDPKGFQSSNLCASAIYGIGPDVTSGPFFILKSHSCLTAPPVLLLTSYSAVPAQAFISKRIYRLILCYPSLNIINKYVSSVFYIHSHRLISSLPAARYNTSPMTLRGWRTMLVIQYS